MCWFTGCTSHNEAILQKMAATLAPRAVDNSYFYYEDTLSFYHAHLKVSDLDKDTSQPYLYQDLVIGLVGEIYNKEFLLRKIGIQENPDDFTECEVIARVYDALGENFINFVNGEFSIFIHDKQEKKYFFFRDRWGTNNLYYTIQKGVLYFASEIKTLIFWKPILNKKNFIEHMTFQFGISPSTIIEGISTLCSGTYIVFQDFQIRTEVFDSYIPQNLEMSFIDTLEQAVKRRIPYFQDEIFVSLSGGPDSNLILYFLKKYYQGEIIAYSFVTEKNMVEIEIAKKNAKFHGITHLLINMDGRKVPNEVYEHEWLVYLPNLWKILKEQYPEYAHVRVEFWGDGKEELINSNTHFPYNEIIGRYKHFHSRGMIKDFQIDQEFLNHEMFDYNLQMIDKLTLRNGIERRLPFTDYELLRFKNYKTYRKEAEMFLNSKWLSIVEGEYGYNLWIDFSYAYDASLLDYSKILLQKFHDNLVQ